MAGKKDTAYQKFFRSEMAKQGWNSPSDIPADQKKSFFDKIDRMYQSEKEKKGDYSESFSGSRAGSLLKNNYDIEEDFYKTNKGKRYRNRKPNGLDNITPRD